MTLPLTLVVSIACAIGFSAYSIYPWLEKLWSRWMSEQVSAIVSTREKMFLKITPNRVWMEILISTFLGAVFGFLLSNGYGLLTFVFTLFMATIGYQIPKIWTQFQFKKRSDRIDLQLVDALNLMANSLKSGLNLAQVIQVVVQEMPVPLSQEFGLVLSQQTLGVTLDEALEKMAQRIPSEDVRIAVHSVLILRETGGDLAETFETIANTIRERRKVAGKIQGMTQQGRTQGLILFFMPIVLGAVLYSINPGFLTPLFTTQLGWIMIIVMLTFQMIGGLWMRKIVTIEV